jgi:NAD(P)H-quinone oxidoreductase subunit 5
VLVVGAVSGVLFWIDRFIVDGFVNAVGALTVVGGQGLRYNTTGQVQFYALSILLGVVLFGALVAWPILAPAVP